MNYINRGVLSISRKPAKSVLLFLLLFILGSLLSGALSIRQAIHNTERMLRDSLPAVARLEVDGDAVLQHFIETGEALDFDPITPEIVREIGNLPHVKAYDIILTNESMSSQDLYRTLELSFDTNELGDGFDQFLEYDFGSLRQYFDFEQFTIRGISNPEMTDIQAGLIELNNGRLLNQSDIDNAHPVALISKDFAQTNNLTVGSHFTLENRVYIESESAVWPEDFFNADSLFANEIYEFQVVGIFKPIGEINYTNDQHIIEHRELQNRIYVPSPVVEDTLNFRMNAKNQLQSGFDDIAIDSFFLLHDPRDLTAFAQAADQFLPEFWFIDDLTVVYGEFMTAMDFMLWFADVILWGGAISIILITSLLLSLFLRDRKYEIGTLLALGERKLKIIGQILFEVLSISIIAIIFSFVSGYFISERISRQVVENQLIQTIEETPEYEKNLFTFPDFNPGRMSQEEMMEAYEVTFDVKTLIIFFSAGIIVILISSLIPIFYTLNLNPKKILM